MISRIRTALAVSVFSLLFTLITLVILTGCDSGTGPAGGTGPELTHGDFFILSDADDSYHYDQYFVVQADHRWEFVEYGYALGQPTNLCQVTRHAGVYSVMGDSVLSVTQTAGGESVESCHMTKAQFQAYPMQSIPAARQPKSDFLMRNKTATGFDAKDLFVNASGWKTYTIKPDPYGFY